MTVKQIETEKENLERIIRDAIGEIVANWNARKTGLSIDSVYIMMSDVTTIGGPKETIVTDCNVNFGIRL